MSSVKIISLGGFGNVTNNMFVYETDRDIIIVDCGIGFPTGEMLGVDLTVPDISYLLSRARKIKGLILSHGHDDHIGALPYLLPKLPKVPIFGSRWALALADAKLKEFGLNANYEEVSQGSKISLGDFSIEFVQVTHSIPETLHLVIQTPVGTLYHAPDFKLDLTPVMGQPTDQKLISQMSQRGILCLLSDCLRAEKPGFTPSEVKLEEMFGREIVDCQGKFFVTTMSSNISRLKQAIDVSLKHGRKIVLVGRSIEKNVELALKMGYLNYNRGIFLPKELAKKTLPSSLTLLVTGSQAQPSSALGRMVLGEHEIRVKPGDKVVFSTDSIPGNELAIYNMVDELTRLGADVVYADVSGDVHVSGHGASNDLKKLIELVRPTYLLPIGGNFRHMVAYRKLAYELGYKKEDVLLPDNGQVVEFFPDQKVNLRKRIPTRTVMVDALGVGDVGNVVLRDRQVLSSEGIVLVIVQVEQGTSNLIAQPDIVTRGFVYAKQSERLLAEAKSGIVEVIQKQKIKEQRFLREAVQDYLEKFFFKKTGRRPMVLSIIIEV